MCRELAARGVTLLEADTDGVYFAVPETWTEADERRVGRRGRRTAAAARPARVRRPVRGDAVARAEELRAARLRRHAGAARRGVPVEPRRAVRRGVPAARARAAARGRRRRGARRVPRDRSRAAPPRDPDATTSRRGCGSRRRPRSTSPMRDARRELAYEAMLASGRADVERGRSRARLPHEDAARARSSSSPTTVTPRRDRRRDYDVEHYVRLLRDTFAARLARAFTPDDFAAVFADPDQPSLFSGVARQGQDGADKARRPARVILRSQAPREVSLRSAADRRIAVHPRLFNGRGARAILRSLRSHQDDCLGHFRSHRMTGGVASLASG